jgi:hypothetical protein
MELLMSECLPVRLVSLVDAVNFLRREFGDDIHTWKTNEGYTNHQYIINGNRNKVYMALKDEFPDKDISFVMSALFDELSADGSGKPDFAFK